MALAVQSGCQSLHLHPDPYEDLGPVPPERRVHNEAAASSGTVAQLLLYIAKAAVRIFDRGGAAVLSTDV